MASIERLEAVLRTLARDKVAKSRTDDNVSVIVGFTQNYAIYVHENLEANHPVGQAKYLEQPARELGRPGGELAAIISKAKQQGKTTAQALVLAGLRLQREAQLLTPVDTGALKASAFTSIETSGIV